MPFTTEYALREKEIEIEQRADDTPDGSKLNANSGTVWDAALVLMHYFATDAATAALKGTRAVELGCGTGVVGIAAAALGADTVLTDYEEVCVLAEANIQRNRAALAAPCKAVPLAWEEADEEKLAALGLVGLDWVLCSALVCAGLYVAAPLVQLIRLLLRLGAAGATCLMSHELRPNDKMADFVAAMKEAGMRVARIPAERLHPQYRCDDIAILEITLQE